MQALGWSLLNVLQALFLASWSVLWISLALVARVLSGGHRVPLWMARTFWGPGLLWVSGAKLEVRGLENVDWEQPHVVAVNHQSMLDVPVCFVALPTNLRFVAKKVLSYVPFLGWYMWSTGMIFINRRKRAEAVETLRRAASQACSGSSILAFPEGTRSRDGQILPFKKGAILLAIEAGMPVVPVAIEGARHVLGPDGFKVRPGTVRVSVGQPIVTAGMSEEERPALIERVREAVVALHQELMAAAADVRAGEVAAASAVLPAHPLAAQAIVEVESAPAADAPAADAPAADAPAAALAADPVPVAARRATRGGRRVTRSQPRDSGDLSL